MPRFRHQHPNRPSQLHHELRRHPVVFPGFQPLRPGDFRF